MALVFSRPQNNGGGGQGGDQGEDCGDEIECLKQAIPGETGRVESHNDDDDDDDDDDRVCQAGRLG